MARTAKTVRRERFSVNLHPLQAQQLRQDDRKQRKLMAILKNIALFILMMLGIVGWVIAGLLALVLSPFVVGMLVLGAVIFAPDMDGY